MIGGELAAGDAQGVGIREISKFYRSKNAGDGHHLRFLMGAFNYPNVQI